MKAQEAISDFKNMIRIKNGLEFPSWLYPVTHGARPYISGGIPQKPERTIIEA